jgi:hypothetical protein
MHSSYSKSVSHILALALIGMVPIALVAQDVAKPDVKTYARNTASNNAASKWDIFVGFSYLSPNVASDGFDNFDSTSIRYSGGLILRYPTANFTPFVHALVGGESAGSYYYQNQWGVVATGGGGLDYNTPLFNHHLAIRLFQADYQFNHQDNIANFNMLRLSAGAVYRIGSFVPPVPSTLSRSFPATRSQ